MWLLNAGMRLDYAHVVVLDGFFGEPERQALLDHLTAPGWDHSQVRPRSSKPTLASVCSGPRPYPLEDPWAFLVQPLEHNGSRLC